VFFLLLLLQMCLLLCYAIHDGHLSLYQWSPNRRMKIICECNSSEVVISKAFLFGMMIGHV
jgi:hypothetical protein